MKKLKKLRLRCQELNEVAHKANGKRTFAVVSGRLKVRRVSVELADNTCKCGADLDTLSNNVSTSTSRKVASEKSNKLDIEKSSHSCNSDIDGVIIASACEQVEIDRCYALLNQQVSSLGLTAVDVAADGNCFFRAAFYSLFKNECAHESLSAIAADMIEADGCLLGGIIDTSPDDGLPLDEHVKKLRTSGYVEGEDAAIDLNEATKREIVIHTAGVKPQRFSPKSSNINVRTPIQIAFLSLGTTELSSLVEKPQVL